MDFTVLAVVALVGVLGPLLAVPKHWRVPVVVGELAGGVLVGRTGFGVLHPSDGTFAFLAEIGFALVMYVAGTHVPMRDPALRRSLPVGLGRALAVAAVSVPAGLGLSHLFGTGHAALYAVLLASSSAALALPILDSIPGDPGRQVLELLPQIAIADASCIVALPLVIDPAHAGRAALGALAVVACAAALWLVLSRLEGTGLRHHVHRMSEQRKFALELRFNLLFLFGLAAVATRTHVSIMLAGFSFGLAVAAIGPPRRLTRQLFAITEGFLGPLFFVWLGASLDLRALAAHPSYIALGLLLGAGALVVHLAMRLTGQPWPVAILAASQVGVPVAAATLGTQLHLLRPGEPAALILGALVTVAGAAVAGAVLGRRRAREPARDPD